MSILKLFFISIFAPLYSLALGCLAYGPWGPLHQIFIFVFKKIYRIESDKNLRFKTLGDFFLRPTPIKLGSAPLVSPVEGYCFEGPKPINLSETISAKGIEYSWRSFQEIDAAQFHRGVYWNFYLAPHNYHWVHAPASGKNLEGFRTRGAKLPVNAFGRWLEPKLFNVNERLTFKFQTEEFGKIVMICVGAMGVSALFSDKGVLEYDRWMPLQKDLKKGERLLGFRLGSTVILLTEKPIPSPSSKSVVRVGDELIQSRT
ncbi:MAG: phosphatidylserine decarboxylase [Bacteriovoracaceae bacterium]|nr:phosphatidylserine decarboxylase [Bacteriovoracaceae bacterium]